MIRARGNMNGEPMLFVGLSGGDVTRLVAGEPIVFHGKELSK